MKFTIKAGLPYLVSGGTAFPVTIHGNEVTIHDEGAEKCDDPGRYSLQEIHAKCGSEVSSKRKARKRKAEV